MQQPASLQNKSAVACLLYRTYQLTWQRGEKYANEGKAHIQQISDKWITATVRGTETYTVQLEFRGGGISRTCSCPVSDYCKHMVAVAILWDEARSIPRPRAEEVEHIAIPPPLISSADIARAYDDPIHANLDILRLASSESGRWSREHAQLPTVPKNLRRNVTEPVTVNEVAKCFAEITAWARHHKYDPYFCAGEVTAAFCEMVREYTQRWDIMSKEDQRIILGMLSGFAEKITFELIDDSDGMHIFLEEHLDDLRPIG